MKDVITWELQPARETPSPAIRGAQARRLALCSAEERVWQERLERVHETLALAHAAIDTADRIERANERLGSAIESAAFFDYYEASSRRNEPLHVLEQDVRRLAYRVRTSDGATLTDQASILELARADTQHALLWQMANQSALAPLTTELQQWACFDLSIAVCALPGTVQLQIDLASPCTLAVRAEYAIRTLGASDEEHLALGTLRTVLEVNLEERSLSQRIEHAERSHCTPSEMREAAEAIAQRQIHLNKGDYLSELAQRRRALRRRATVKVLILLFLAALVALIIVLIVSYARRRRIAT
jgi:hypothetical protein